MTFDSDPADEVASVVFEAPAVEFPVGDPDGWTVVLRTPGGEVVGRASGGGGPEPMVLVPPAHVGRNLEAVLLAALRRAARATGGVTCGRVVTGL